MQKEVNQDYLLWRRIKTGETQAFHELYLQYADILFSFGSIYTKDQEFLKDCIHDLFFDLYKYRKNLADNDHIRNYLFKSLKRKIQASKNGKLSLVYTSGFLEENDRSSATVESDFQEEQEATIERIKNAIGKLPDRQQEALNLRFQVGLSYHEVAVLMEISVESVRTLIYRSVKVLREELKIKESSLLLFFMQLHKF